MPLRLGVAGFVAAAAVAVAAPAHADTTPIGYINIDAQDLTIGAAGPGDDLKIDFGVQATSNAATTFTNATLTIDVSGLAGVAAATSADSRCSTSGTTVICALGSLTAVDSFGGTTVTLHLKAVSGASAGQSGLLTMTGSADGIAPTPAFRPATITLADGPDLVTPPFPASFTDVKRGSTITTPHVTLQNIGSESAQGVTIVYTTPYEFPFVHLARNCEYASYPGTSGSLTVASCSFDNIIRVGQTYAVKKSQQTRVRTDSVFEFGSYIGIQVYPGYRPPSAAAPDLTWVRGTEQQLELAKTAGGGPSSRTSTHATQADINQFDGNYAQSYRVTDGVSSDLAVTGDTVTAAAGSTVPVTIGVHENGPGSLDFGPVGTPAALVTFTPPPGTTVTSVPDGCGLNFDNPTYACDSSLLFLRGTTQTFTFQLKVSAGGVTGAGSVSVIHGWNGAPPTGPDVYDTDWDDNTAAVTIDS